MGRQPGVLLALLVCIATIPCVAQAQELVTVDRRLTVKDPLPLVRTRWGEGVVFPVAFGHTLLHACSRTTLGRGDSYWMPAATDIEKAESILAAYTKANRIIADPTMAWPDLRKFHRQYIGVIRAGKKTVYGSYFPAGGVADEDWRQQPFQICDGGPAHFGVETDLAAAAVVHIDFDGCLCSVVTEEEEKEVRLKPDPRGAAQCRRAGTSGSARRFA